MENTKSSVLNVSDGGYGKTVSDIPLSAKCSGICAEAVGIGFQAKEARAAANSPFFWRKELQRHPITVGWTCIRRSWRRHPIFLTNPFFVAQRAIFPSLKSYRFP